MGGLDSFCQPEKNGSILPDPALVRLKGTFRTIIVVISALGVAGNVLNLFTLRSPSLRNVPFMFIRALALFDLISLAAILIHFALDALQIERDPVIFYEVWVQDVLINSFLVAGLYCAVLLTIERYLLIRKPFSMGRRLLSIENTVLVKIGLSLLGALVLHSPMALQWQAKCKWPPAAEEQPTGGADGHCQKWARGKFNNRELLCREPFFVLFTYYKMGRECLRFFCVLLLISLNVVIARHLQMAKRNRRLLIKRVSVPVSVDCALSHSQQSGDRASQQGASSSSPPRERNSHHRLEMSLMRSFTEKKLTALMVAICVIFAIGNIPQMVVMAVQNEGVEHAYSFQVFRQVANTAEVLNHCLNFFIFCMASSEYCRAFLSLRPVRCLLRHIPLFASLARARLNGRLESSAIVAGMGHESASECLRKKSSVGGLLAGENGLSPSSRKPSSYRREIGSRPSAIDGPSSSSAASQQRMAAAQCQWRHLLNGGAAAMVHANSGEQRLNSSSSSSAAPSANGRMPALDQQQQLVGTAESGDDFL